MTYVILFEAEPDPGREEEYFALARSLNALLPQQPGFISIDRAHSLASESKLISISFWESEQAIEAWADHPLHREAQGKAKTGIFKSMRITRLRVLASREVPVQGG